MWRNSIYIKAASVVEFIDDSYVLFNEAIDLKIIIFCLKCFSFLLWNLTLSCKFSISSL